MTVHYQDDAVTVHAGDCLDVLRELPDASIDAVVTDPPYGLAFMGKAWDDHVDGRKFGAWCVEWSVECLRVLKPGGHMLAFGGSRTWHRLACAVEDAGFELRDSIAWVYASGFPKSLDVSKAIDKAANAAPLWDAIRSHLREWRDRAGMTNPDINAALGLATNGAGMARHWTSEVGGQHSIPSKEMWGRLKVLLGWPDCDLDAAYDAVKDGAERPVVGVANLPNRPGFAGATYGEVGASDVNLTAPATDAARQWQGWGTALKPAFEPIVVARKPLIGTVAANVQQHGTGALNIAGCRVPGVAGDGRWGKGVEDPGHAAFIPGAVTGDVSRAIEANPAGRWPSNLVLTHALDCTPSGATDGGLWVCVDGCPVRDLDQQSGVLTSGYMRPEVDRSTRQGDAYGAFPAHTATATYGDTGGASRFFPVFRYEPKAPTAERPRDGDTAHPTVKPLDLMRWLVRLVTPPGGLVLDPFAGSGTTAEACVLEGFRCVTIEREPTYLPLIVARLTKPLQPDLFGGHDAA